MKKIFAMFVVFLGVLISVSYGATKEILVKHTTVHTTEVGALYWHSKEVPCPAEGCGKNHNSIESGGDGLLDGSHHNGCPHGYGSEDAGLTTEDLDEAEYTVYPYGDPVKLPDGWVKVGERADTYDKLCGNRSIVSTTRETRRHCEMVYWTIEKINCKHEVRCIRHKQLESEHGSNGVGAARYFSWDGEYLNGSKCDKCGGGLYTGRCISNCKHTEVCELHGKDEAWHTESSGYIWTGRKQSEEKCPKCDINLKVGTCREREKEGGCDHSIVCEKHSLFEDEHPYKDGNGDTYKWTGTKNTTKCKCGYQLKKGICAKVKTVSKSDDETIENPGPVETHVHQWIDNSHTCIQAPSQSSIITSKGRSFEAEANLGKKVYYVEDTFGILGKVHVDSATPKQDEEKKYLTCTFELTHTCSSCGVTEKRGGMCGNLVPYTERSSTADFNETYYGAYATFEGFRVENDVNSIRLKEGKTDRYNSSSQRAFTDIEFGKNVTISSLYTPELRKDDATGLFYGLIHIKCDCGHDFAGPYPILFDYREPGVESSYTLTVKTQEESNGGLVKVDGQEYGKASSKAKILEGSTEYIYAKPNDGYEFIGWYDENGKKYSENAMEENGALKSPIIMPGYNLTLIARFRPIQKEKYTVWVYSDGNGKVKFDGEYDDGQFGTRISTKVVGGDDISIMASPNVYFEVDNWESLEWTWDGEKQEWEELDNGNSKLTLSNVNRDYIIRVKFIMDGVIEEYGELMVSSDGPGIAIGGTKYAIYGQLYPVYTIPNNGARFEVWKEWPDGINTSYLSCDNVVMPERKRYHLKAFFKEDDELYKVTVKSDGNGDISIDDRGPIPEDTATVKKGTDVIINAYPDEDFEFEKWTDEDGNTIPGGPELKVTIDEDKTYIAHFEYNGVGETKRLTVESAGGGEVTGNVSRAIPGKKYPIEAIPDDGYEFLYWYDVDARIITDYTMYDLITMPNKNLTLVAHFRECDKEKYELILVVDGNGRVEGAGKYSPDTTVSIKATPGEGYEFTGWYDGTKLISKDPDSQIKMPYHDLTLRAVFKKYGSTDKNLLFKILSIRDVRWKDYFTTSGGVNLSNELNIPNNAGKTTVLVDSAELVDNSYDKNRNIVYGYAVEFEWVTRDVTKRNSKLVEAGKYRKGSEVDLKVIPSLYARNASGGFRKLDIALGTYGIINSGDAGSREQFMITGDEELIYSESKKASPQVTWRWIWYLPLDMYEEICDKVGADERVVVGFDMGLFNTNGTRIYSYVDAINSLKKSNWGGKVFTYRTDKNLLTDIYDNENN